MTDFTTPTMITRRSHRLARMSFPLQGILHALTASLALLGKAIASALTAYGRALELAYLAPYGRPTQRRLDICEDDLEGRDPNW